ncbi:MAG: hypothetical protein QOD32_3418 [Pyrinomonadaceae bacterium]|jgi:hypothetical protein|nr:hypothetical protein [Pyrinomonadaceae bacterium]
MSVIGRLDDQVEAVLINPLKGRRAPDDEEREPHAPHAPVSEERDSAGSVPNKREAEPALPVWLL